MRIGVNCCLLQENIGGMRQYFHRLFRELLDNDHENTYVFFYFDHNIPEFKHLRTERWKENAILLTDQNEINLHLGKIDLYFCPFGSLWPRPVGVPSVLTLPDIQEKYFPEYFTDEDLFYREFHCDFSTYLADHVITISEFSKQSIMKHHGRPGSKIEVAYLCTDKSFQGVAGAEAGPSSVTLPERYIFYPANRWLHKNHDGLLRALLLLKQQHRLSVPCVFTGHDVENGYPLAEKVNEYGLNDQVRIIGYVTNADLKRIYKQAELLCFPSFFEGFGIPVIEAMMLGCPVVCSRTSSLPEVGGESALYFDPASPSDIAEKIKTVWYNKDLRKKMIAQGFEQASKFSTKRLAESHLKAFKKAVKAYRMNKFYFDKYVYSPLYTLKMKLKKRLFKKLTSG